MPVETRNVWRVQLKQMQQGPYFESLDAWILDDCDYTWAEESSYRVGGNTMKSTRLRGSLAMYINPAMFSSEAAFQGNSRNVRCVTPAQVGVEKDSDGAIGRFCSGGIRLGWWLESRESSLIEQLESQLHSARQLTPAMPCALEHPELSLAQLRVQQPIVKMVQSAVLGFPRMGVLRDLKKATEAYWGGKISQADLLAEAKRLRLAHWKIQKDAGVDIIPSNDFALYDQVLHQIQDFGAVPERYTKHGLDAIDEYFAMGRGHQKGGVDVPSLEMVKWFDSNYHYVKPTLQDNQTFKLVDSPKAVAEFKEAKEAGINTRPVLVGPVSFLHLGKADRGQSVDPIDLLDKLLPVYEQLLVQLKEAGAETVQIDEPTLVFDLPAKTKAAFKPAYEKFAGLGDKIPKLVFTTYFGDIVHNLDLLPKDIYAVHIDLVRNPEQLETVAGAIGSKTILSAGVVDGRNIWKTNFKRAIETVESAVQKLGKERVIVATSSSLLHTPHTLASEKKLDPEIADWFSFASEKAVEIAVIAKAVTDGPASVREQLEANAKSMHARATSSRTNDPKVKDRQSKVTERDHQRQSEFTTRIAAQQEKLNLPLFPTTTIGSFPQTSEIRVQRNKFTKGEISEEQYDKFIEKEIKQNVKIQEELGLDVFVHGEPERNDMVQYFGERLNGYTFTTHAWVQSYGSRCVRPPIIVGDISRPAPMTVKESKYAVSVSSKPMKGMLTGPVTCLRWSFPRDDVHQSVQAQQLALALRDEVIDLEKAGVDVIQVDEPALREGLPLRSGKERDAYLEWAVNAFKLSTAGVEDATQIHSHFCYSEFQDFFHAIAALDADVLSIENSKSDAKLLRVFVDSAYPRHIGPGVYDIHSPRVPSEQEIRDRIEEMLQFLKPEQLWIDPDCGLKTRQWKETKEALVNMVNAAKFYRTKYAK
ncbi:homocysteine methyltransferase Met26 [Claviceps citrina]|nr:homocysteine methyltransferase Met26 [Claviceps citrina]